MKSIKEKAEEAKRNTHPLFESIRESDGKPVSIYDQDNMISMFEAGANYVLDAIQTYVITEHYNLEYIIEQLKK